MPMPMGRRTLGSTTSGGCVHPSGASTTDAFGSCRVRYARFERTRRPDSFEGMCLVSECASPPPPTTKPPICADMGGVG